MAQYNTGFMYYNGEGIVADKKQAFYWFKKCAKQGNPRGQFYVGFLYYHGEGVLTDKKQAAFWVKKSWKNGNKLAKDFWDSEELHNYLENDKSK
jgi:TPR repeat protein